MSQPRAGGASSNSPRSLLQHERGRGGRDVVCQHRPQGPAPHYNRDAQAAGTEPAGHGAGPRGARAPGGVLESPLCWGRAGFISALLPPPQVFQDYGFHPLVQRWIIGQCLCVDERTVSSYGIRRDGDTAFLYLLSAKRAELTRQRYEEDQAQLLLNSIAALGDGAAAGEQRQYNTLPSASTRKGPGAAPVPSAGGQEGQPGSCPNPAQILPKSCPNPP